jgi:transcriptional regulator with AAA-type ATPase domain
MSGQPQTLLCWHAERAGLEVLTRAIKALRNRRIRVDRVIYLVQEGREPDVPQKVENATVEPVALHLEDPTMHSAIYPLIKQQVLPLARAAGGGLHINVSPGTPAMHSVWLILHAGGAFPEGTRLWSSQYSRETKRSRIDPVDFEVTTYLAEIHRLQRAQPERAVYEPDAASSARRAAFERLARYSKVIGAPLLVLGERGIGKTRLVETYVATLKAREPVVTVACGGLDSSLAESLLFGHRKGAFTGAEMDRRGLLAEADGGILFLDEVQDLPKSAQRKLVRVFQDRQRRFRPVGSDRETSVDVELVCASNLPVAELREQLDADLFDRLSHLAVRVPPLRECRADVEADWAKVWRELRQRQDLPEDAPWTPRLARVLGQHPLPGNLRDLQRLAVLLMAWWGDTDEEEAVDRAVEEWSQWTSSTAPLDAEFGSGSRNDRIKWFRARLALWAKDIHETWTAAGEALGCDEKTLRQDATLLDET